jgi:AcrR family transcriptional regulator
MKPNPRICRAIARRVAPPPPFTLRQQERDDRITAVGEALMAQFGRNNITFSMLAVALQITTATLRFHYTDLDALLAQILWEHMESIEQRLRQVPATAPNYRRALQAAYREATRDENGKTSAAHILLQRDSRLLPEDERRTILKARQNLAKRLKSPPTRADTRQAPVPKPQTTLPPHMVKAILDLDARYQAQQSSRAALQLGGATRKLGGAVPAPPNPPSFMKAGA